MANELCMNCFSVKGQYEVCPYCGYVEGTPPAQPHYLTPGTILGNHFIVGTAVGFGGFGITYKCFDTTLGVVVAIKEFYPMGLVNRSPGESRVGLLSGDKQEQYKQQLKRFLLEAQSVAQFGKAKDIVNVYDFFEENQTAYIVMEYIEGLTLEQYIQTNGVLSPSEMLELLLPLLHSLKKIHEKGLIHRDISPNNMILGMDNKLHLIDFGAAKIKPAHPGRQQTIILKKGYAPPEQYMASGNIGAWSDIYALCATIYYALSGQTPIPAIDRLQKNPPQEFTYLDSIPMQLAGVIERGLALQPAERYKTMEDFIYALKHPESVENGNTIIESASEDNKPFHRRSRIALISLCAAALATGGLLYAFRGSSAPGTVSTMPTAVPMAVKSSTPAPVVSPASTVPALLTMDNVTGLSQKKAKKKIRALDPSIKICIKKKYDTTQTKGRVISQSIATGTVFNAGSLPQITLTISRGAKPAGHSRNTAAPAGTSPKPSSKKNDSKAFDVTVKKKNHSFEID